MSFSHYIHMLPSELPTWNNNYISYFQKSPLQYICVLRMIPSPCLPLREANDWYIGYWYSKSGSALVSFLAQSVKHYTNWNSLFQWLNDWPRFSQTQTAETYICGLSLDSSSFLSNKVLQDGSRRKNAGEEMRWSCYFLFPAHFLSSSFKLRP